MNFSNFFIDVLSGNEPTLSLSSKKSASPAFLFSDIMKVCEEESTNTQISPNGTGSGEGAKEIFSAVDSIINIQPKEFLTLNQLVATLINASGDQQPTITSHDVDEAKITKQQFIIPENKLVDLLGELIGKGNYPLGPFINQLQNSDSNKPISLSFKSGSDKLTISFNPIKVDENYTNKIISDEYGFVNKLIVKEGLFSEPTYKLSSEEEDVLNKNEESLENLLATEDETKLAENFLAVAPNPIFFRTEIIKIISANPNTENSTSGILPMNGETTISTFLAYKNYVKENKVVNNETNETIVNTTKISANDGTLTSSKNDIPASKSVKDNVPLNSEIILNGEVTSKIDEAASKLVVEQDVVSRKNISISSLMDGLSEEEKSVFKNFAAKGELKEITFTKEVFNAVDKQATPGETKVTPSQNGIQNNANEVLANGIKSSDNLTSEDAAVINGPAKSKIIEVGEAVTANNNSKPTVEIFELPVAETQLESNRIVNSEEATLQETAKIFVKMNGKSSVKIDAKSDSSSVTIKNTADDKTSDKLNGENVVSPKSTDILMSDTEVTKENADTNQLIDLKSASNETITSDTKKTFIVEDNVGANKIVKPILNNNTNVKNTSQSENEDKNITLKTNENTDSKKEIWSHTKTANEIVSENKPTESERVSDTKQTVKEENPAPHKEVVAAKNLDVTQNSVNINEKIANPVKPEINSEKVDAGSRMENLSKISVNEEKSAITKDSIENKEISADDAKTIKHASQDGKANLTSDEETSKRNSHESFKSSLTQAVSNDFDVEKTKSFADVKTFHEPVKIIKQNEIIPEFSKFIQQGEKQTMTFQISPENLGKVKLIVDLVNNQIQTKIEVESEQIKQFIQSNVEQLKQNLQSSGIQLSNVNISLADYNQKNAGKMFSAKKKSNFQNGKEISIEEITNQPLKKMGYSTYEFLA